MLKRILVSLPLLAALLSLASCGGGGGGGVTAPGDAVTPPAQKVPTTATLKIALVGTLPVDDSIVGVGLTLFFPSDLTPAMTNGAVAPNVVAPSGTFAGGIPVEPIFTPPATPPALGKMLITLTDASLTGVTRIGEVATVTLKVANGATPTASSFVLSTNGVIDFYGRPIPSLNAVVSEVILQ